MAKEEPEWWILDNKKEGIKVDSPESVIIKSIKNNTKIILFSRNSIKPWTGGVIYIENSPITADWKWEVDLTQYIWKRVKLCIQNGTAFHQKIEKWFQLCIRNI